MDRELEQYILEYRRKMAIRRGVLRPGVLLLCGGLMSEEYFLTRENACSREQTWGFPGLGIGGGVMSLNGLTPGKPIDLVDYYSGTCRR